MKEKVIVNFKKWTCSLQLAVYSNDRIAIVLNDDGGPVATATVNIPDVFLHQDEVIIKDYSENEGILNALLNAGVVEKPTRYIQTGFVTCPICKLLIKP